MHIVSNLGILKMILMMYPAHLSRPKARIVLASLPIMRHHFLIDFGVA